MTRPLATALMALVTGHGLPPATPAGDELVSREILPRHLFEKIKGWNRVPS